MKQAGNYLLLTGGIVLSFFAQQPPHPSPVRAQSPSTVALSGNGEQQTLEINNVTYEVTGDFVPSRPKGQRLLLRQSNASKQVLGDIGQEASTTLEAWPLGVDVKQKPLYVLKVEGTGGKTLDTALFVADRGVEEVDWWSVYRLGTGQHLFDTYVPLVAFSISTEIEEQRYMGLEVPPDNSPDARLRAPNVVAVLSYASEARVKKEVLITCDDPKLAPLIRSYADATRTLTLSEGRPPRAVKIRFEMNYPSAPAPVTITLPLASDDLDIAHAQLPRSLHLAVWKR
jgi:hypothetical protein